MTDAIHIGPQDIIDFWFVELSTNDWFAKSDSVDAHIKARFEIIHRAACACELSQWRETPLGRLAEIIVLDQFSRNIFRDEGRAFAADALALCLAQETIAQGHDALLDPPRRRSTDGRLGHRAHPDVRRPNRSARSAHANR